MLGALYATTLFFSIINATVIQPVIAAERAVSYRERAAGTYSVLPFTLAIVRLPIGAAYCCRSTNMPAYCSLASLCLIRSCCTSLCLQLHDSFGEAHMNGAGGKSAGHKA